MCLAKLYSPSGMSVSTSLTYAMFVHPDSEPQIALHWTGSEHATWHTASENNSSTVYIIIL